MIALTIRTDKPEAEIGLYNDQNQLAYRTWQAHRELSSTILSTIKQLLKEQNLELESINGIVVYPGPGSFTGLRIGTSVANSLAHALGVPIVAGDTDTWQQTGVDQLLAGANNSVVVPEYGALPNVSTPKR